MAEKHTKGLIFENRLGLAVNDILPEDDANKAFSEINVNIAGVEWEAEPPEPELQESAFHVPHINNNKYVALVDN